MRNLACDCGKVLRDEMPEGSTLPECPTRCGQRMHYAEHSPTNHPKHYTSHPSGIECIQIAEHFTFCIGQVIKYVWRHGLKDIQLHPQGATVHDGRLQDLKKAAWYLNREIQRIEKEKQ